MTANISKSIANLLVWYCRFAHLNKTFMKNLTIITPRIIIILSNNKLFFCNIYIKAKMIKQLHWQPQIHTTISGFWIHADVGGSGDIYAIFCEFCYFILFIYEAINYIWVRFLKKKLEALAVFWALVTLLEQQYGIQVFIFYTNFKEFNSKLAINYFSETSIIWESSVSHVQ